MQEVSVVKPTRCTRFSNLYYSVVALNMFRTVFPSIIRSLRLYIQHQVYVKQILLTACQREREGTAVPSRSRQQAVSRICFDICLMLYVHSQTPYDGRRDRQKHVERSFISSNLIHNSYINYIKLNASTCFERHSPILRRSMSLIVRVCSLWYSHSLQVAVLCTC